MTDIDWDGLRTEAISAMRRAYAPYSNYSVGAAALGLFFLLLFLLPVLSTAAGSQGLALFDAFYRAG